MDFRWKLDVFLFLYLIVIGVDSYLVASQKNFGLSKLSRRCNKGQFSSAGGSYLEVEDWNEDSDEMRRYNLFNVQALPGNNSSVALNKASLIRQENRSNSISIDKAISLFARFAKRMFMPVGYPKSVPTEYLEFQAWNLLQDLSSYLRNIMTTKAILTGMGVGRSDVTAIQATIHWILRDGASLVGGLLFTSLSSYNFGQNVKLWRLFADVINDIGISLDMIAPIFPNYFLLIVCLGSICKALCGIAAGATGAAINIHWGQQGNNVADVLAKNGAQHTMVSLLGLLCSVKFARLTDSVSTRMRWGIYIILTGIHLAGNYRAMRILALNSLNISRLQLLITRCLALSSNWDTVTGIKEIKVILKSQAKQVEDLFTPRSTAKDEPLARLIIPEAIRRPGRVIKLWSPISTAISIAGNTSTDLINLMSPYRRRHLPYFFVQTNSNDFAVCFARGVVIRDQAQALFEAEVVRKTGDLVTARFATEELFALFWEMLIRLGWKEESSAFRPSKAHTFVFNNN